MERWPARLCGTAVGMLVLATRALGANPAAAPGSVPVAQNTGPGDTLVLPEMEVVSRRLDVARQQIEPSLGATRYDFSPEALQNIPQGENSPLNQVLLQAPGVVQDSFGQIHLRGEHANVQYRINGVELPEGISVFGQALETRFAKSMSLITGALPAQYGLFTAGVVDIQTRTGYSNPGLTVSMYGGSWNWLQPSFEYGGHSGAVDWFVTGDYLHNGRGIENPSSSWNAVHDTTNQFHGLGYVSGIIDPNTRVSLILGGFNGQFRIPNNPGLTPGLGLTVNGISNFNSAALNERQREITDFAILSLQKHIGNVDFQISAFTRYSSLAFSPDPIGDLLFNGIAQHAIRQDWASGVQSDASWRVNDQHTIRAGFLAQGERVGSNTVSSVLAVDPTTGMQTSDQPFVIGDGSGRTGGLYGLYLQDEWRVLKTVTINYGARFDLVDQFTRENQISPRVNVVWKATPTTTVTAGYSRYFVPPPFELVAPTTIGKFFNTTAAPAVTQDDTAKAERSNYFDAGVSQVIIPGMTLGFDAFFKQAKNLIDEGQFGAPIILTAFNYQKGQIAGGQLTGTYERGPWSLYGNLSYSRAIGKNIDSSQFNFSPDDLAFISQHWIHLDHDQRWTGSAGAAYTWHKGSDHPTLFSVDMTVQSGLRASTDTVPNGIALKTYGVFNASIVQKVSLGLSFPTEFRLDLLNIGDTVYQIRNGTGVGVGAPQYGLRRTVLAGVSQKF